MGFPSDVKPIDLNDTRDFQPMVPYSSAAKRVKNESFDTNSSSSFKRLRKDSFDEDGLPCVISPKNVKNDSFYDDNDDIFLNDNQQNAYYHNLQNKRHG